MSPASGSEVLRVATAEPLAIFSSKVDAEIKRLVGAVESLIPPTTSKVV